MSLTNLHWTRVGMDIAGTFGRLQPDKGEESLKVRKKKPNQKNVDLSRFF